MQRLLPLLLVTAGAAFGCKPSDISSVNAVSDTPGTPVDWRLTSTLGNTGALSLQKTGTTAADPGNAISAAQLEITSAPDGQIFDSSLVAGQYMALRSADDDLRFNVAVTTGSGASCYVSNVLLNGTNDQVLCRGGAPVQTAATAGIYETSRAAMESICNRLAGTPIVETPTSMYASYDPQVSHDSCLCLNGQPRSVTYATYFGQDPSTFEAACKARSDGATTTTPAVPGQTGGAASSDSVAANQNVCLAEQSSHPGKVSAGSDACYCGTTTLRFDEAGYLNQPELFRHVCETAAAQ